MALKKTRVIFVIFFLLAATFVILAVVSIFYYNTTKQKLQQPVVFQQKDINPGFVIDESTNNKILSGYIHSVHLDTTQPYLTVNSNAQDFLSPFGRKKIIIGYHGTQTPTLFLNATSPNMTVKRWEATTPEKISSLGIENSQFISVTFYQTTNDCTSLQDNCQASHITLFKYAQ